MYVVKLMGGLGNQMFQYAFGRSLSIRYRKELKLDLSFLTRRDLGSRFVYRDYDLDIFELKIETVNLETTLTAVSEPHYHFDDQWLTQTLNKIQYTTPIMFQGYWQSPKYFAGIESELRSDFTFKRSLYDSSNQAILELANEITSLNSVLINIRRTDYLTNNYHCILGLPYIQNALEVITTRVDTPTYFVFSDDIRWCKQNLPTDRFRIVDHSFKGDKFSYYLELMTLCKHFVIPNSTFAWWAAWLAPFDDKVVVAPKNWFLNTKINVSDLVPDDWTTV